MGEEIVSRIFYTYCKMKENRGARLLIFRGISVLLLNSFSAKIGFVKKAFLDEILDRV